MTANEPLTQLGRYKLKRVIGRGAMGLVYEGIDPRLDRTVAVKTILKSYLLDEALASDYSARFVREAQAAGRLNHPNIVTVFDFGEQGDVAYLVMEFIRGRELAAHFDDNDFFDLPQAVRIMGELLDALAYAHEHGIVHRDVKPANVMIESTSGRVKLTDFGVARLADANTDRTQPGTMVGTPSYMSPEQIQGLAVGSRTDLFAAGVVLYQFLTRQKPFTGGGQWTVQRKIMQDEPVAPSFANRAVPPVFDAIVRRALAKDPDDRYPTAAEFAADLRAALGPMPQPLLAPLAPLLTSEPDLDPDATVIRPPAPSALATLQPPAANAVLPPAATSAVLPTLPLLQPRVAAAAVKPAVATPAATTPPSGRGRAWAGGAVAALALLGVVAWRLLAGDAAPMPATVEVQPAPALAIPPPVGGPVAADTPAVMPPAVAAPAPMATTPLAGTAPEPAAALVATTPAAIAAKPAARPAVQRAAPAPDARCRDLRQRMQLGETLPPESQQVFQKECRR